MATEIHKTIHRDGTITEVEVQVPDSIVNRELIEKRARQALKSNRDYLQSNPTAAQVKAQVEALTRQVNGLIRLTLNELDTDQ